MKECKSASPKKSELKKFTIRGYITLRKTVGSHGNVSAVYLPKAWAGRDVAVVLLPTKSVVVKVDAEEK